MFSFPGFSSLSFFGTLSYDAARNRSSQRNYKMTKTTLSVTRAGIVICVMLCVVALRLMMSPSNSAGEQIDTTIDYSAVSRTSTHSDNVITNTAAPIVLDQLSSNGAGTSIPFEIRKQVVLPNTLRVAPRATAPPSKSIVQSANTATVPAITPYRAQLVRFLAESTESQSAKLKSRFSASIPKLWLTYHLDEQNADEVVFSDVCYEWSSKSKSFIYRHIFKTGEDELFSRKVGYPVGQGGRHSVLDQGVASIASPPSAWSYPATEGQDRLVLELLDNKKNGFFVDLAARYWHRGSNSFALETYHDWQGICIEPDNIFARGLVLNRTCLTICNNPVSEKNGDLVRFNYKIGGSRSKGNEDNDKITVTLNEILRASNAPAHMDYLSLDVEDHEMAVLSRFDFQKYRFNVLSVERPVQSLHELLSRHGYRWLTQLKGNFGETVYLHQSVPGFKAKMNKYRPVASASWRGVMHPYMRSPPWYFNSTTF